MEPVNVGVTNFGGAKQFVILNECAGAITDVRVTHFTNTEDKFTEVFIKDRWAQYEDALVSFLSQAGHDDHWTVTFQKGTHGFMCRDLTGNMSKDGSEYQLTVRDNELHFHCKEGNKAVDKSEPMLSVFHCVKS